MSRIVVDLDGTLCSQERTGSYHLAKPRQDVIDHVNRLWLAGHEIVIFTARGMETCAGNVELVVKNYAKMTEEWLKKHRVLYSELLFGKPAGDLYVDDKSVTPEKFQEWALPT